MLRAVLIAVAALVLAIAVILLAVGSISATATVIWIIAEAVIFLIVLLLERGRYRPRTASGPWAPTGERFRDPTSGKWITVEYNERTGQRRYVEESEATRGP